jgi:hypothetical protein
MSALAGPHHPYKTAGVPAMFCNGTGAPGGGIHGSNILDCITYRKYYCFYNPEGKRIMPVSLKINRIS